MRLQRYVGRDHTGMTRWISPYDKCIRAPGRDTITLMAFKATRPKHPGHRGDTVSLYPLRTDQAVDAIFAIKAADVRKIIAKRPGKGKGKT